MYVYDRIWQNKFNRSIIFSSLMTMWSLFIELYFFFWPKETLEKEFLINFLYTEIFGMKLFLDIFHVIIWSIFFFFTWMTFALFKQISQSQPASISEYIVFALVIGIFAFFMNNIQVAFLFFLVVTGEFLYMYLSLRE